MKRARAILIAFGILGATFGAQPAIKEVRIAALPKEEKLKVKKADIIAAKDILTPDYDGAREVPNSKKLVAHYAYKAGAVARIVPDDAARSEARKRGVTVSDELLEKRTPVSITFATDDPAIEVTQFFSDKPQFFKEEDGTWRQIEYATTTPAAFELQVSQSIARTAQAASDDFFPDPNPETSSVDGWADRQGVNESWATIRAGAGNASNDAQTNPAAPYLNSHTVSGEYNQLRRAFYVFNTSSISDTDTIDSCTLSLYISGKLDSIDVGYVVTTAATAANTSIASGDYDSNDGATLASATTIDGDAITTGAYNDWACNAAGVANVSVTGVSKFASQFSEDQSGSAPSWANNVESYILPQHAETTGTSQDPKLTVVHSAAAVAAPQDDTYFEIL